MEPREVFGANVRRLRARRGLSQEALADACELHPTEISRLERGVRDPRLATIARVARALDVAPARLLEGIR
ncbi:MAG TPA: helix-turn-helix transcriptional regulator [Gaiellaceae bacterium]|nr:helix-turn-helix transcriptional regulator [Gaiellaceae bacterium]